MNRRFEKMTLLVFLSVGFLSLTDAVVFVDDDIASSGASINAQKNLGLIGACYRSKSHDLSGLGIVSFGPSAFLFCDDITSLDLSDNWIKNIPEGTFSTMPNLEHLSLANNDLRGKALKGAFRGLANLKTLNLTHNPLSKILNDENFVGLSKSCDIYIDRAEHFHTITPHAFGRSKKLDQKNQTTANESKNCTENLSDRPEMFDVERSWIWLGDENTEIRRQLDNEPYSDVDVKMCTDGTTVRFVDFSNDTDTQSPNCRTILLNENRTKLKIEDHNVTSFDSGWFRIRNTSVNAIYLYPETLEKLTSHLLNDLPENIRFFSLQRSDLTRLHKGVMVNKHLRGLDLSINFIRFIEEGAFAGMNLTGLNLAYNPLITLDYVSTLPKTLLWLNLGYTGVLEVPGKIFSHLKNLLALNLGGNHIVELRPPGLDGLVSLQSLDLAIDEIKNLRPGVFRNLSALTYLNLRINDVERLERGVFDGLGCLKKLDLPSNKLTGLDGGSFQGLTDNLESLDLSSNRLEILEAGTFVGVPKYNLLLEWNNIRRIGEGVFDLPYLRYLDLRSNNLTTIDRGAAKNLGSLMEMRLGSNPIQRLDNGALAGLPSETSVRLAETPIKIIQAGVFDDY